jgi:hypothetical protein
MVAPPMSVGGEQAKRKGRAREEEGGAHAVRRGKRRQPQEVAAAEGSRE